MKHNRYIDTDYLSHKFLGYEDIRIEFRCESSPIRFIAKIIFDGIYQYIGVGDDPLEALDRAFYQIAGKENND